ncbi:MAG TPA: XdhC family protein [Vicinamibacterales bacterium]|jgi:xanthine dehydrogenase accessory factor
MTGRASDFYEKLTALSRDRRPFAVATVVARRAPISAHLGDRAIVYADGRMEGFVGGACAREIVRTQALELLRTRQPRLVSIRPDAADAAASGPEHVVVSMSCASEGAVDVYIEPFVDAKRLIVAGATPIAEAVARAAASLDYDVFRVVDAREQRDLRPERADGIRLVPLESLAEEMRDRGETAAIVASQGHYDEDALRAILSVGATYVGLVASRKRWATMRAMLEEDGVRGLDAVRNPAGLDLGARTPGEVAVSILAELVQAWPRDPSVGDAAATPAAPTTTEPAFAIDPVCGMRVEMAGARHTAEIDGTVYYFCCANCRTRFVNEPRRFAATRG